MNILKQILPKELHNSKIKFNTKEKISYFPLKDIIFFNRYQLLNNKLLIKSIEKYLNKKLNKKEHIIFALLHELGHRYYIGIKKTGNMSLYVNQKNKLENKFFNLMPDEKTEINFKLAYWKEIKEEYKAMKFAKRYFKIYQKMYNLKTLTKLK